MKLQPNLFKFVGIYLLLTVGYYLLLSSLGCLFFKENGEHYTLIDCLINIGWMINYVFLIHWWLVMLTWDFYNNRSK